MKGWTFRIYSLVFLCLVLTVSCAKERKLPKGIYSVEKMTAILTDMELAKGYNYFDFQDTTYPAEQKERMKFFFRQVLDLHQTDTTQFFKSYDFYAENPHWLRRVYRAMKDSIEGKIARQTALEERRREANLIKNRTPEYPWLDFPEKRKRMVDSLHKQNSKPFYYFESIYKILKDSTEAQEKRLNESDSSKLATFAENK